MRTASAAVYLVASLTSSPTRLHTLGPTLAALSPQSQARPFDEIVLNLPSPAGQTASPAELPPDVSAAVTVNRVPYDWGPAAKLVPTVRYLLQTRLPAIAAALGLPGHEQEAWRRTHIVLVADDVIYPPGMALSLAGSASPSVSEAASGSKLKPRSLTHPHGHAIVDAPHGAPLDVAEGRAGWRIPIAAFGRDAPDVDAFEARMRELLSGKDARESDDLVISAYLAERNVPRALHKTERFQKSQLRLAGVGNLGTLSHVESNGTGNGASTGGEERWLRAWRVLESGRLPALPMPERWDLLCPAQLRPAAPPACQWRTGTRDYHVWGERHSGTNAIASHVRLNFGASAPYMKYTYKHMWISEDAADIRSMTARMSRVHAFGLPAIIMVREPVKWLLQMHREPHHARWLMGKVSFLEFLQGEWRSWFPLKARERCAALGFIPASTVPTKEIEALPLEQQSACAVRDFASIMALRSTKLRLWAQAFELVPADEQTRREQLVHTVSRRAVPGSGRVLVLRFEDMVAREAELPCMLAHHLGACPLHAYARMPNELVGPNGAMIPPAIMEEKLERAKHATVEPCANLNTTGLRAFRTILGGLDWAMEALYGYAPEGAYRRCLEEAEKRRAAAALAPKPEPRQAARAERPDEPLPTHEPAAEPRELEPAEAQRLERMCPAQLVRAAPRTCRPLRGEQRYLLFGEWITGADTMKHVMRYNFATGLPAHQGEFLHAWMSDRPAAHAISQMRMLRAGGRPTIVLVREPVQWLLGLHNHPEHAPWARRVSMRMFVSTEWRSLQLPGALERCAALGLIANASVPMAAVHALPPEQQQRCAVHAFASPIARRKTQLRLMRDAFDLRPANERTRTEQLVHTVSARQPGPGGAPVLVLRYEDLVARPQHVPCVLARHLGGCPTRTFPYAKPFGRADALAQRQISRGGPKRAVSVDPCPHAYRMPPETFRHIVGALDWELEAVFGYGGEGAYRACTAHGVPIFASEPTAQSAAHGVPPTPSEPTAQRAQPALRVRARISGEAKLEWADKPFLAVQRRKPPLFGFRPGGLLEDILDKDGGAGAEDGGASSYSHHAARGRPTDGVSRSGGESAAMRERRRDQILRRGVDAS